MLYYGFKRQTETWVRQKLWGWGKLFYSDSSTRDLSVFVVYKLIETWQSWNQKNNINLVYFVNELYFGFFLPGWPAYGGDGCGGDNAQTTWAMLDIHSQISYRCRCSNQQHKHRAICAHSSKGMYFRAGPTGVQSDIFQPIYKHFGRCKEMWEERRLRPARRWPIGFRNLAGDGRTRI